MIKFSARTVFCSSHGVAPLGGLICDRCKHIYPCELGAAADGSSGISTLVFPTIDDSGKCSCGAQLIPSDKGGEFSARVVCASCTRTGKVWGMQ